MEHDDRGVVLREPGREPAPALVELRRDQCRQPRVTFVELRRGVEQVSDALLDRRIGRVGNTAPVPGAQELGDALLRRGRSRRRRAAFQVRSPRSEAPRAAHRARSRRGCERCASRRARPPRTPSARGRGWPSVQCAARQPSGNGRRPTRSRAESGSRARTATALQERSARPAARRTTPPLRCRSERCDAAVLPRRCRERSNPCADRSAAVVGYRRSSPDSLADDQGRCQRCRRYLTA